MKRGSRTQIAFFGISPKLDGLSKDIPMLRAPSFQKSVLFVLAAQFAQSQPVQKPLTDARRFTLHDAIWGEWMRAAPNLKVDALSKADRERYKLTLQRIGAPGMPKLLPPELENPTIEIWEAKAKEVKTPQERFTALHFLNRLKSPKALGALNGLKPEDARTWPKYLYLDANIATARLQGGEVSKELQSFLDALKAVGKVEPVRAQAARLRLVMAGKEKELLPPVKASPGAVLSLIDAWNRSAKPKDINWSEAFALKARLTRSFYPTFLEGTEWRGSSLSSKAALDLAGRLDELTWVRLSEAKPTSLDQDLAGFFSRFWAPSSNPVFRFWTLPLLESFPKPWAASRAGDLLTSLREVDQGILLPALRRINTKQADALRGRLLNSSNPIARSAAIEDLPETPSDLDSLTQLAWMDRDLEPQQTLIESYSRWKLPKEKQLELLKPWLQHPDWACRYLAYQQLVKLDATTPWPTAPEPNEREIMLLKEAERLASNGKPVRLRITFSGKRRVTMRLDPTVAPINVANLARLARKGFFNGRLVPRVVPDFVVQMGSPYDTMDGGPGYTVRCENSLDWYGPGSVGMALSGKDTGGSQFFITTNATPHLTGKYTRMGELEDMDHSLKILDALELGAKIERVEVLR